MENKNITILSQYAQSNLSKIVFSLLGIIVGCFGKVLEVFLGDCWEGFGGH